MSDIDHIRYRPGMYIGPLDNRCLNYLALYTITQARDVCFRSQANEVILEFFNNRSCNISDNGLGIPIELNDYRFLESVATEIQSIPFTSKPYRSHFGPPELGYVLINALSTSMEIVVHRHGKIWKQSFIPGSSNSELEIQGSTDRTGTILTFTPDPDIFESDLDFDIQLMEKDLQTLAYLHSDINYSLIDHRNETTKKKNYHAVNGVRDSVDWLNNNKYIVHSTVIHISAEEEDGIVEMAFQWTDSNTYTQDGFDESSQLSYVNDRKMIFRGTHINGFRAGIGQVINNYLTNTFSDEAEERLTVADCQQGLTYVLGIRLHEPNYLSNSGQNLGNPEARALVARVLQANFTKFLNDNPIEAEAIIRRICTSRSRSQEREMAKAHHLTPDSETGRWQNEPQG